MTGRRRFRRAVLLGGVAGAALAATAGPALASPSAPGSGQATIVITSVSPQVAAPGGKVAVSGAVINPTGDAVSGPLSVQLWSSPSRLPSQQDLSVYLTTPGTGFDRAVSGAQISLPGSLPAHGVEHWKLTVPVSQLGMRAFGVYPLAAQLMQAGLPLASARSLLPFWPGRQQARAIKPLSIGWVWPLIDTPQRLACPGVLLSDELASAVARGGRLERLLAAGLGPAGQRAHLTWAIDPALIADVNAMTKPYRVGGSPTCSGGAARPASAAAKTWLAGVRSAAAHQAFFVTPYDDVDVAALAHQGLDPELARAFADGQAAAARLLGQSQRPAATGRPGPAGRSGPGFIAWPADGIADYSVLENLAADHIGTVILDSNVMPAANPLLPAPSAATTTPNGLGSELHVLLANDTLTQILSLPGSAIPGTESAAAGGPSVSATRSRPGAQAAAFAREQWFLAETAMIAAEPAGVARAIVVAPPRGWDPSSALAQSLLSETSQPWLRPVALASLAESGPTAPSKAYQPPSHFKVSPHELSRRLLRQARRAQALAGLEGSLFTPAQPGFLSTALAAAESSAWRGSRAGERRARAMLGQISAFVTSELSKIRIIEGPRVTLGGKTGAIPVTIGNGLASAITVKLRVIVPAGDHLSYGPVPPTIQIAPHTRKLIKIPVRAAAAGSTTLTLRLTTVDGRLLPGQSASLTVEATHFGTLAIVIIGVALLVFVVTAAARAIRRGGPEPGAGTGAAGEGEPAEPAGTIANAAAQPDTVSSERASDANQAKGSDDNASTTSWADRARY